MHISFTDFMSFSPYQNLSNWMHFPIIVFKGPLNNNYIDNNETKMTYFNSMIRLGHVKKSNCGLSFTKCDANLFSEG